MRLALYQPDIPQNTGTILRLAACLGIAVDVIGPAGFDISDRVLRRAALDYLAHVDLTRHASWEAFLAGRAAARTGGGSVDGPSGRMGDGAGRLILLTSQAQRPYWDVRFRGDDVLLLGRETAGVPEAVRAAADLAVTIPMRPGMRSLNVAVAAAMVVGEALRQLREPGQ